MVNEKERPVERVRKFFAERGLGIVIQELPTSTRTAELAAKAVEAPLGSIVKSLVFLADGRPVLVLVAGDRRAHLQKIAAALDANQVEIADAKMVRRETGYPIGGVPPVAHIRRIPTLVDESLLRFEILYAAAGAPNALFAISTAKFLELVDGKTADIATF